MEDTTWQRPEGDPVDLKKKKKKKKMHNVKVLS